MYGPSKKARRAGAFLLILTLVWLGACSRDTEPLAPVVIIGLDGATWNVIEPLIKDGKLPNLKKLVDRGASGPLESCCGTISPAVWTTIVTGRDADEHGIFDFTMTDPNTGQMVKVNNTHRQKKALWEILSDRGLRTGIINLFSAYPFDEFNGFGYLIERGEGYPEDVLPAAERVRQVEPDPKLTFDISRKLLGNKWDLFLLYDRTIDATQHRTWMYYEPKKFDSRKWLFDENDVAQHGDDIPRAYMRVDVELGRLLDRLPPEAAVVLVSDHGGKANTEGNTWYLLSTNRLLQAVGLMKLDPGFMPVPGESPLYVLQGGKPALGTLWDRNIVYALNVEGARRGLGLAADADETAVFDAVVERLRSLRVGKVDLPVFESVSVETRPSPAPPPPGGEPEQIRVIVAKERALLDEIEGDLHTLPVGPGGVGEPLATYVVKTPSSGVHARNGIIILSGPMIQPGQRIEGASVFDVTPTVLTLLGIPPGKDMRGKALTQVLTPDFAAKIPRTRVDTYEDGSRRAAVRLEPLLREDQKRLRSLGYLR